MAFPARHPGRCPACEGSIRAGDLITMTDDGAMHANCDDATVAERPVVVCERCWLARPCECDE
jgi:hypothetical protein